MRVCGHKCDLLCVEGGGTSGFIAYRAMFSELQLDRFDLPCDIAASSAGSICVGLLVAGIDVEPGQIDSFLRCCMDEADFISLADGSADYILSYANVRAAFLSSVLDDQKILDMTLLDVHIITERNISFMVSRLNAAGGICESFALNWQTAPHMTLFDAMYASCSIPGIAQPLSRDAYRLFDGDLCLCAVRDLCGNPNAHEVHITTSGRPESKTGHALFDTIINLVYMAWKNFKRRMTDLPRVLLPVTFDLLPDAASQMVCQSIGREFAKNFEAYEAVLSPKRS